MPNSLEHDIMEVYTFSVDKSWTLRALPVFNVYSLCNVFSEGVAHSKLVILLFALSPSMWFSWDLFYGLGMNVMATNLCT